MLQSIRDKAQGWIAWAIVILISIPFALWGIQEYLGVGSEPVVAEVDGQEITERELDRSARDFRESLRARLGDAYSPDIIPEDALRAEVRARMIDERVLLNAARDWGMRVGDDQVAANIRGIEAFQRDGRFDNELYEMALRNRGMNSSIFVGSMRQEILMNQVQAAVYGSSLVTDRQLAEAAKLAFQQRRFAFALIPSAKLQAEVAVSEGLLKDYYAQEQQQFQEPERVSVQYLLLDVADLARQGVVSESEVRAYFEQHAAEFRTPEERRVRHILVSAPAGAETSVDDAARAKAQALRDRIAAGEDFATVAREASEDPGSAESGGDLGWIAPGMMVGAFEEAAYGLVPGTLSEPVRSQFGYHVLEVLDIRNSGAGTFEDMQERVEVAFRRHQAENLFYDHVERLANLTYENAGTLAPAAEELGLELEETALFSRDDAPAPVNHPKAVVAAFSEEVLARGNNSEVIELAPNRALVLRVLEHEPAHVRPLDEIRDRVVLSYMRREAAKAAVAAGEAALSELAGEATEATLQGIAEERGWKYQQPELSAADNTAVPRPVLQRAFELPPPAADGVSRGGVATDDGYAVIEVSEVQYGDLSKLDATRRAALENRLRDSRGRYEFDSLLAGLRARADVRLVNPQ